MTELSRTDGLGEPGEHEAFEELDPHRIAQLFGTTAKLTYYEIRYELETNKEIKRIPVWVIDIIERSKLRLVQLFVAPEIRQVGVVSSLLFSSNLPPNVEPDRYGETNHTARLEGVQQVEVRRYPFSSPYTNVSFIIEDEKTKSVLQVDSRATFRFDFMQKEELGKYAIGLEEIRNFFRRVSHF